ncbi:hypothetical protein CHS0354_008769 [Potamilus streckersoni]|uniref:Uncharacterized protein n=1 Tax=Potamilus streckersoni TaxID=2493646 RepID=A0AAE0SPL1_9BIVA|nr:hypothetical protein CHS0354_008769 [Potamilus streckersoni]
MFVYPSRINKSDHSSSPPDSAESSVHFLRNLCLWKKFPRYTRSSADEKLVQRILLNNIVSPYGSVARLFNKCNGTCHKPQERIQTLVGFTHHACCISTGYYQYYNWLTDTNGKNRTMATFDGMVQYFYAEDCLQMNGCTACKCRTQDSYVTAVVQKDDKSGYEIAWFKLKGSCKCINGLF